MPPPSSSSVGGGDPPWNVVGVSVLAVAAVEARSVALAGFGLDSLIEIGAFTVVPAGRSPGFEVVLILAPTLESRRRPPGTTSLPTPSSGDVDVTRGLAGAAQTGDTPAVACSVTAWPMFGQAGP